jgi:hypothetical protein
MKRHETSDCPPRNPNSAAPPILTQQDTGIADTGTKRVAPVKRGKD